MHESAQSTTRSNVLTFLGIMLLALNLRPGLTSVAPVLNQIGRGLGLSALDQGILTTLPVLFLGIAAPLAPALSRRLGIERAVLVAVALLAFALLARPYLDFAGLLIGTSIVGSCIGIMGVLLPGIVKRDFPQHASLLTGLYTAVVFFGASSAAGVTEPLRMAFDGDWRSSLMVWAIPAGIASMVWASQLGPDPIRKARPKPGHSLFRDPLAWQVTLYMGLQSVLAFAVFGWLPTILQSRGLTPVNAGFALSLSIMLQISTAILAPWASSKMRDQRLIIALAVVFTISGILGCIVGPLPQIWLWVVILGLGQGATFSMALTLLAIRAGDPEMSARLSGMAQGVGYTMAAFGPLVLGVLNEWFDDWRIAGMFLALTGLGALAAGIAAGRDRLVGSHAAANASA